MNKLLLLCVLFLFVGVGCLCYNYKIHISFSSFFKKGFRKHEDNFGMFCFTNSQGTGKTFSIIDTVDSFGSNYITISNVESFCKHRPKTSIYMTDFNEIVKFISDSEDPSKFLIFFDEIFDAMGMGKLNRTSRRFLTQLRKRHLYLFTSCQIWGDLPVNFRKLCRYQISCKMFNFLGLFAVLINEVNDGLAIKWDQDLQEFVCPRLRTNIKKCSLSTAQSYDTYETICSSSLMTVS